MSAFLPPFSFCQRKWLKAKVRGVISHLTHNAPLTVEAAEPFHLKASSLLSFSLLFVFL